MNTLHAMTVQSRFFPLIKSGELRTVIGFRHYPANAGDDIVFILAEGEGEGTAKWTLEAVDRYESARDVPMDDVTAAGYKNRRDLNVTMKLWHKTFDHEAPVTVFKVKPRD